MIKPKKGKKKKLKVLLTPKQKEQRKQKSTVRSLFRRIGFQRVRVDGFTFTFEERTGELDDLFIFENLVILCEYTTDQSTTQHIAKKKILFDLLTKQSGEWISFFASINSKFKEAIKDKAFSPNQYQIRIVYVSTLGVSDEIESACPNFYFLDGTKLRYFESLSKTIHRSARFEFFKYLQIPFEDIGEEINKSSVDFKTFDGHVLPENFSSFPPGFKVVSFYADPATLLRMSYVLRRDSWLDQEGLYQRILSKAKIRNMRRYLTTDKRVFVNNIIVTLPKNTKLNDPEDANKNLDPKSLVKVEPVIVSIPNRPNIIGIVDGQHRIYCYHEGNDRFEGNISKIRNRQNLLVTGVIFPDNYSDVRQRKFEAKLFLEINDTQARTKADLKQSIELLLNPYSTTAIAKALIQRLSEAGPLRGLLQTNYFDPPELIKTSSIVSYGLKPLVKLDGTDSVFHLWQSPDKLKLKAASSESNEAILQQYVNFCADKINDLLLAAKLAYGPDKWKIDKTVKRHILSPTAINGFVVCLRLLIEHNRVATSNKYQTKLSGLDHFKFENFKSSQWRALGEHIYNEFF